MSRKRYTPEQVIRKLREADVLLGKGITISEAARKIGIREQTYYRWRKEHGGTRPEAGGRTKEVEEESARPKAETGNLILEPYTEQVARWPRGGRQVLAQFDDESVTVYQAYSRPIAAFAVENGILGGDFSYARMSWIKPSFLWMMCRCGWATQRGQDAVLAVRIKREGFDRILEGAVHSTFVPEAYESEEQWQRLAKAAEVLVQWDPDRDPFGHKVERRAIQLGLRKNALTSYGREWIVSIQDMSEFVREQRTRLRDCGATSLVTPREDVYPVRADLWSRLGILQSSL